LATVEVGDTGHTKTWIRTHWTSGAIQALPKGALNGCLSRSPGQGEKLLEQRCQGTCAGENALDRRRN